MLQTVEGDNCWSRFTVYMLLSYVLRPFEH